MTKILNKNSFFIFLFALVALAALAGGLYFYIPSQKALKITPQTLSVEKIDGNLCLVTEHQNKYEYFFKLEQNFDGDYLLIDQIKSESNTLVLADTNVQAELGLKYRFSVCYGSQSVKSKFSSPIEWEATTTLGIVEDLAYQNEALTWSEVEFADKYAIKIVAKNGRVSQFECSTNSYSLSGLPVGRYKVFVQAKSDNSSYIDGDFGEGLEFDITRKNEILSATLSEGGVLTMSTSQEAEEFEIRKDGVLLATFSPDKLSGLSYQIDLSFLLKAEDKDLLTVRALGKDFILDSDWKQIV